MKPDEILKKRRNRAIATILTVKEREVDVLLPETPEGVAAAKRLRSVIHEQLNDFFEIALDIAMSGESATFEFNPDVWEGRIEAAVERIESAAAALVET